MASMLDLNNKSQMPYVSIKDKESAIKSCCDDWEIDINYPIIAKGNIIESIEAIY